MTKSQIAEVVQEIATLLELKDENQFKIRAYANAARSLETFGGNLSDLQDEEALGKIPGIGKAIAIRAARDGANIVIAAKTVVPHPKLPGTIATAKEEIEQAGGSGLACAVSSTAGYRCTGPALRADSSARSCDCRCEYPAKPSLATSRTTVGVDTPAPSASRAAGCRPADG